MASVSLPPTAGPPVRAHSGRALVVWSWLMIPMFALWCLPALAIMDGLKALIGLNLQDPVGTGHALAAIAVGIGIIAAFMLPFVVGVALAWLAHRRGARTAAVVPLVINLCLIVGLFVLSVLI